MQPVISDLVPSVATLWDFIQSVASFSVALIAIWIGAIRPYMARKEAERKAEIAARDAAHTDRLRQQIEEVVQPIRHQVEAIHRTTHINGGHNDPPTLRDEVTEVRGHVEEVSKQVDVAIRAVGAVAVNQARLSERFDHHERDSEKFVHATRETLSEHGIELPEVAWSLPPEDGRAVL